jgi:hypothetical protein
MGNPLAGVGGKVTAGGVTLANVGNWAISQKSGIAKSTAFQATGNWETNTATLKSFTMKCDGRTDPADTTGQVALFNGIGATFAFECFVDATHKWAGSAILDGLDPKASVDGLDEIAFSFTGSGACTYT